MSNFSHVLAQTMKIKFNWGGPTSAKASNIFYGLLVGGAPSSPTNLSNVATGMFTAIFAGSPALKDVIASTWSLESIETFDNSGGTNFFVDPTASPMAGGGGSLPPQVSTAISWPIASRYRGGHPRTYLPGVLIADESTPGSRMMSTGAQAAKLNAATNFLTSANSIVPSSGVTFTLGTIRASSHGAQLTPPVFFAYTVPLVHLRFDSQRRRSGKEILIP